VITDPDSETAAPAKGGFFVSSVAEVRDPRSALMSAFLLTFAEPRPPPEYEVNLRRRARQPLTNHLPPCGHVDMRPRGRAAMRPRGQTVM
jgi:hypothetical protein